MHIPDLHSLKDHKDVSEHDHDLELGDHKDLSDDKKDKEVGKEKESDKETLGKVSVGEHNDKPSKSDEHAGHESEPSGHDKLKHDND